MSNAIIDSVLGSIIRCGVNMDSRDALCEIKKVVDKRGMYGAAKVFGGIVDGSAEDFAIGFMSAYNEEVVYTY